MKRRSACLPSLILVALTQGPSALAAVYPDPKPQLQRMIDAIVEDVAALRDASAATDCRLYALVDEHMYGEFDLARSGRGMFGKKLWPADDPALQQRFVAAFYDYLVAKYGDLLIHVDSETLRVFALDEAPESEKASLNGRLTMTDGEQVDVSFTLRYSAEQWWILDVVSKRDGEGRHSQASSYSDLFRGIVFDVGFDGLIDWLEKKAAPRRQCGQ